MTRIEIISRLANKRFIPIDQLVRIALAVEFYLCPRVQSISGRRKPLTIHCCAERGPIFIRFIMESNGTQLFFGQQGSTATARNGAVGITQTSEFSDRQPNSTSLTNTSIYLDYCHSTVRPKKSGIPSQVFIRNL